MDPQNSKTAWIESLFDVSEPYLYVVVLPPLMMFALGLRRPAVVFLVGAVGFFTLLNAA